MRPRPRHRKRRWCLSKIMRIFIKRLCALLFCAAVFALPVAAVSYPEPTEAFFVNDFAGVISTSDRDKMQSAGEQLYERTTAQVVVVTVDDMDGSDLDTYSLNLARSWGIGSADKDNGVLLLLAKSEREVKIEVGSGLEGALNDGKCGRIIDTYGMESFRADDFSTGLSAVYDALINEVYIEYGLEPDPDYQPEKTEETSLVLIAPIAVVVIIILAALIFGRHGGGGGGMWPLFFFFGGRGRGGRGGGGFGGFGGGGGFSGGGGGFSGGGAGRGF